MKQEAKFIEKRDNLRKYLKLTQVFANTQLRTKIYGQKVNGAENVALTDTEIKLCKQDLEALDVAITEFKKELP
jgi:hypothetical protein